MKAPLPAALLLLLGAGALQAALVRRHSPGGGGDPPGGGGDPPEPDAEFFSRHLQPLSELFTKQLPQQLRLEELRSQAEAYVDRANKQLAPLAQEIHNNFRNFFTSLFAPRQPEGHR